MVAATAAAITAAASSAVAATAAAPPDLLVGVHDQPSVRGVPAEQFHVEAAPAIDPLLAVHELRIIVFGLFHETQDKEVSTYITHAQSTPKSSPNVHDDLAA